MPSLSLMPTPDTGPVGPLHLGYRLFAARERRGVPATLACEALSIDQAELRKIEAGGAIPHAVVKPLRAFLQRLEDDAVEAPDPASATDQDAAVAPEVYADSPPPRPAIAASWPAEDVRLIEQLEAARASLDISQAEMAPRVGIGNTTYSSIIRYIKPLGPAVRERITTFLAEAALQSAAEARRLPDDDIAPLRGAFLDALINRQISYPLAADLIGIERQVLHQLITHPGQGIALADAQRIQAWLDPAPETPTIANEPATVVDDAAHAEDMEQAKTSQIETDPADCGARPQDDTPPDFDPMPAILDAIEDMRRERAGEGARSQPIDKRPALSIHVGVLTRDPALRLRGDPAGVMRGDTRVQALLDKFPALQEAGGHEMLWFESFLQLAQLVLGKES